ncbi:MAG: hypothetical protein ABIH69_07835 [bacterium]
MGTLSRPSVVQRPIVNLREPFVNRKERPSIMVSARPGAKIIEVDVNRLIDPELKIGPLSYAEWDHILTTEIIRPEKFEQRACGFNTLDKILAMTQKSLERARVKGSILADTYHLQFFGRLQAVVERRLGAARGNEINREIVFTAAAFYSIRQLRAMLMTGVLKNSEEFQASLNGANKTFAERGITCRVLV